MFRVLLKGDIEPIQLSDSDAKQLMGDIESGKATGMLKIAGMLISISAIKGIVSVDSGKREYKATQEEMDEMENNLRPFSQKKLNGRLVSPFDQYLLSLGVQRLEEDGSFVSLKPEEHYALSKVNAQLELRDYYQWHDIVKDSVKEKEAHFEMVKKYRPSNFKRSGEVQSIGDLLNKR